MIRIFIPVVIFLATAPVSGSLGPTWVPSTKQSLTKLASDHRDKHLPVVVNFDNAIMCRDLGLATLAVLINSQMVTADNARRTGIPTEVQVRDKRYDIDRSHPLDYADALAQATRGSGMENRGVAQGYRTQLLNGLTVADVVAATGAAYGQGLADNDRHSAAVSEISVPGCGRQVERPYVHPEMLDLLAGLLDKGFSVWVVGTTNVWSLRYLIAKVINPKLLARGSKQLIDLSQVVGSRSWLQDPQGKLHRDADLARKSTAYRRMDDGAIKNYRITTILEPTVAGTAGAHLMIEQIVGRPPFLAISGNLAEVDLLARAEHRLWLARLDDPDLQQQVCGYLAKNGADNWLVQPVIAERFSGFVETGDSPLVKRSPPRVAQSWNLWHRAGLL